MFYLIEVEDYVRVDPKLFGLPTAEAINNQLKETYIDRSEEHTSELQSHSFISYAVFCLKKKIKKNTKKKKKNNSPR